MATEKQIAYWESKATHGEGNSRLYHAWSAMKQRCSNPNNRKYDSYGGRGITVCDEWANSYLAFKKWAIENGYSDCLTIDRIDNEKGYSPDNCRWITNKDQQRNKRNNRLVTINGETKTLAEWSEISGIGHGVLWQRLFNHGWSYEKALTTPVKHTIWNNPDRVLDKGKIQKLCQCDKDGNILATFETLTSAAKAVGVKRQNISSVLYGKTRTSGGYYWKLATEEKGGMNIELVSD